MMFLLLLGGCNEKQHTGPQPLDYGEACDANDPDACSRGQDCVPSGDHGTDWSDEGRAETVCSMPCEEDADCPQGPCWGGAYPCQWDGYCLIGC